MRVYRRKHDLCTQKRRLPSPYVFVIGFLRLGSKLLQAGSRLWAARWGDLAIILMKEIKISYEKAKLILPMSVAETCNLLLQGWLDSIVTLFAARVWWSHVPS